MADDTQIDDFEVLNRVANTDQAKLTNKDGSELSPLARIAAAIWLEADYQEHLKDTEGRMTRKTTRKMMTSIWGIMANL